MLYIKQSKDDDDDEKNCYLRMIYSVLESEHELDLKFKIRLIDLEQSHVVN